MIKASHIHTDRSHTKTIPESTAASGFGIWLKTRCFTRYADTNKIQPITSQTAKNIVPLPASFTVIPYRMQNMPMIVSTMYGNRDYGSIFGFFCMTAGIGGMLQSMISMVYDVTGSYLIAWVGMTALGIVAIIIYMSCIRPVKEDKSE